MHRAVLLIVVPLILAACSSGPAVQVEVERGGPAANLRFHIDSTDSTLTPAPISMIQVRTAALSQKRGGPGALRWALAHRPGTPPLPLPAVVQYGVAPENYAGTSPVSLLPFGGYEVRVNSGGVWRVASFRVTEHGTIE